ncbi:MAG: DUF1565 domain-containing protein, partial [Deltaproteobacteria bacterium]|nr:DUF1565 domain-containing protein [Deltaproteobacteria bacterium]
PGRCVAGGCLLATTILYVDGKNGGEEKGTRSAPFRTIMTAVKIAKSITAIFVAEGTYREKVVIDSKHLEIVGGYPGAKTADYAGGKDGDFLMRDPVMYPTRVDAGSGPALALRQAGSTLVAGFSITGGGRGVLCEGGAPLIVGCRITDHVAASLSGGGIFADHCDLTLRDSEISRNVGSRGGGIASDGGTLTIEGNQIRDNKGKDDHGGGLYLVEGKVTLRDNHIAGNEVGVEKGYGWGGGVAIIHGQGVLQGNVISGNLATTYGSGVFIDDGSDVKLENELYVANRCGEGGAGLYVDGLDASTYSKATLLNVTIADHHCADGIGQALLIEESTVIVRNTIFWNNGGGEVFVASGKLVATYTDSATKLPGTGNLSVNPGFAGKGAWSYNLLSTRGRWDGSAWVQDSADSPCIDTGDPATGIGREPMPHGGRPNMGAFGRTATAS